ncbi:hypothetical protein DJ71_27750 [Halorubrum sp. E3]|nr:hypothetical protein DJ71_27750 [Halorubrum sp. E3]
MRSRTGRTSPRSSRRSSWTTTTWSNDTRDRRPRRISRDPNDPDVSRDDRSAVDSSYIHTHYMTDGNNRKKAQAVFFSIVMVLSMVGGSVALAGSAAAVTDGPTLDNSVVQPETSIEVSATHSTPGNDVTFAVDVGDNGEVNDPDSSDDLVTTTTSDSETGEATATIDLGALSDGDYTVYAIEEGDQDGNPSIGYARTAGDTTTLTVDGTPPEVTTTVPANDDTISTDTPEITIDLTEEGSEINTSTLEVTATAGQNQLFQLNEPNAQGISYDSETQNLTVDIEQTKLDSLPEGDITVDVTGEDEAGKAITGESASFSFTVDLNPVDITIDNLENANSQTITADVSSTAADIESAEITIDGAGDYSETFDTSSDLYTDGSFSVEAGPEEVDDIAAIPEGDLTVTVSATDADGTSDTESRFTNVDTQPPIVDSITVNDGEMVTEENAEAVSVIATFNETVDPSSVAGTVTLEEANTVSLNGDNLQNEEDDDSNETVVYEADLTSDVENEEATVSFSDATDTAEITNSSLTAEQTFEIDTVAPDISTIDDNLPLTTGEGDDGIILENVVDLSEGFSVSGADGNEAAIYVSPGQTGDFVPLSDLTDQPLDDFDSTDLPDGAHTLKLNVSDAAGNEGELTTPLYVDNEDPSAFISEEQISGEVNISETLEVSGTGIEEVTYGYTNAPDETTEFTEAETINVNQLGSGSYTLAAQVNDPTSSDVDQIITPSASVDGESLDDTRFEIETEENASDANLVDITVTSDSNLTGFNVIVTNTDGYNSDVSGRLPAELFDQTEVKLEDDTTEYVYDLTVEPPRDGEHQFTLANASLDNQFIEPGTTATQVVDARDPSLDEATLVSANESSMTVDLQFSEPLDSIGGFENFQGATVTQQSVDLEAGTVTVTVDDEVQTGDETELVALDVAEQYPDTEDRSTTTATGADVKYELQYDSGISAVSIPAETGSVALDDVDFADGVDSVMTYNESDNSWDVYDAETGDGDLQEMTGGEGYIVKAGSAGAVDLNVQNVPSDNEAQAINSVSLDSGWNLVGAYQEGNQPVSQALDPLPSGADYSIEKGYTGTNVDTLEPGAGYWMFTNDETAYHVPVDYTGLQSSQPEVYNVNTPDSLADGEDDTISAEVDADDPIDRLVVDIPAIGVEGVELTDNDDDGVYDTDVTDYSQDIETTQDVDVTVTAFDIYGNLGQTTVTPEATENVAPSISNVALTDDTDENGIVADADSVTISADVTDAGTGVETVEADLSDFGGSDTETLKSGEGDTYTTSIDVSGEANTEGVSVDVSATDGAANEDTVTSSETLEIDNAAPPISGFSVDNTEGKTVNVSIDSDEELEAVTVSGTEDASDTELSGIGAEGDFTESGDAKSGFTYTATLSENADGTFGATLNTAKDAAGNDGAENQNAGPLSVVTSDEGLTNALEADYDASGVEPGESRGGSFSLNDTYTSGLDAANVTDQGSLGSYVRVDIDPDDINTDNAFETNGGDTAISGAYITEDGQVFYTNVILSGGDVFFFVPDSYADEELTFAVGNFDQRSDCPL